MASTQDTYGISELNKKNFKSTKLISSIITTTVIASLAITATVAIVLTTS
jgi:hypothetical protein